ncbi:hypothetical protein D9M71_619580 [compost metagenome]
MSSAVNFAAPPTLTVASALRAPSPVSEMAAARSWILPPSLTSVSGAPAPPVLTAVSSTRCRLELASRPPAGATATKMVPVTSIARACTRTPSLALMVPSILTTPVRLSCSGFKVPYIKPSRLSPAFRMSSITARVGVATDNEPTFSTPLLPTSRPCGSTKNTRPPTVFPSSRKPFKVPSM